MRDDQAPGRADDQAGDIPVAATPADVEIDQLEAKLKELRRLRRNQRMSEASRKAKRKNDLPALTAEQRKVYAKLRPIVGREAALQEVQRERCRHCGGEMHVDGCGECGRERETPRQSDEVVDRRAAA